MLLPEFGRAIRRAGESRTGAPAVHAAMQDEEVLDEEQRDELVRSLAAAMQADEGSVRRLLPLVATLAMAAIGQRLREHSPEIPWFGTRPDDHFDAPLLNALAALFEQDDEARSERQ